MSDRICFPRQYQCPPRSRVMRFLVGTVPRHLIFPLNMRSYKSEIAPPHSPFSLTPTAREGTPLGLSAAINMIDHRHPRRNPLTSRRPGRGRLLLPLLLHLARRHPPQTL